MCDFGICLMTTMPLPWPRKLLLLTHAWLDDSGRARDFWRHTRYFHVLNFLTYQTPQNTSYSDEKGCVGAWWAQGKGNKWYENYGGHQLGDRFTRKPIIVYAYGTFLIMLSKMKCFRFGSFLQSLWKTTTMKLLMDFFLFYFLVMIIQILSGFCLNR